jgi:sirohydrochlorin ferrochelatase
MNMTNGIIIVDHGSRRSESNEMLERVAVLFGERFSERYSIVEPAHMELAEPSIATAYARCVERGAERIVIAPFFLGPGKHWTQDIPSLTAAAAIRFPQTRYHVTPTLGIDDLILELLEKRVRSCLDSGYVCDACQGTNRCNEANWSGPMAADPAGGPK